MVTPEKLRHRFYIKSRREKLLDDPGQLSSIVIPNLIANCLFFIINPKNPLRLALTDHRTDPRGSQAADLDLSLLAPDLAGRDFGWFCVEL